MEDENAKLGRRHLVLSLPFRGYHSLPGGLDVLLQFPHGVFQRRARVVYFIHDQDVLAHQAGHAAQTAEIQPLRARHHRPGGLHDPVALRPLEPVASRILCLSGDAVLRLQIVARHVGRFRDRRWSKRLVEAEPDGLDGDVWAVGLFEEGPQDPGGDIAASADGDDQVRLQGVEDVRCRGLAELVDL